MVTSVPRITIITLPFRDMSHSRFYRLVVGSTLCVGPTICFHRLSSSSSLVRNEVCQFLILFGNVDGPHNYHIL